MLFLIRTTNTTTMMQDESWGVTQEPVLDSVFSTTQEYTAPVYNETVYANPINEQSTYNGAPAYYQEPVIDSDPVYNGGLDFSKVGGEPIYEVPAYSDPINNMPVYDTPIYQTPVVEVDYAAIEAQRAAIEAQRLADLAAATAAAAEAERIAAELRAAQLQSLQDEIARMQAAEAAALAATIEQERLAAELQAAIRQQEAERAAAELAYNQLIASQQYAEAEQARQIAEAAQQVAIYNQNLLQMQQLEAAQQAAEAAQRLQAEKEAIAAQADADRAKLEEERIRAEQAAVDANQVLYTMQGGGAPSTQETPIRTTSVENPEVQRTNTPTLPTTKVGANLKPVVIGFGIIVLAILVAKALTKKNPQ